MLTVTIWYTRTEKTVNKCKNLNQAFTVVKIVKKYHKNARAYIKRT